MEQFKLAISREAQRVSLDDLPQAKQDILAQGVSFDPEHHDVFQFFVAPEFYHSTEGAKKTRRKRRYSNVNRLFIKTRLPTTDIKLLGMYPITRTEESRYGADIVSFIPIAGKLRAHGRARDAIKQGKHWIIANRTDEIAQWIFLRPYIEQRTDFGMIVLCLVPRELDDRYRFLRCDASAQDSGREVQGAYGRKVRFPGP
jgi:hypothetical protein